MAVSMGPIGEPFGYSKQQRPAGTLSAVSASPAIIYSCWRPSLVTMAKLSIHSGYLPGKRPPPGAGNSSSPSPPLGFRATDTEENKHTPNQRATYTSGGVPFCRACMQRPRRSPSTFLLPSYFAPRDCPRSMHAR